MTKEEQALIDAFVAEGKLEHVTVGDSAQAQERERAAYEATERAAEDRSQAAFEARLRRLGRV